MSRKLFIAPAVIAATLAFAGSAEANVYCVPGVSHPSCTDSAASIDAALSQAAANPGTDDVRLAAQTYTAGTVNGYSDAGTAINLIGAGEGQTIITGPDDPAAAPQYLQLNSPLSTATGFTVTIPGGANSSGDRAIVANGAAIDHVTVDGAGTDNVIGVTAGNSTLSHLSLELPLTSPNQNVGIDDNGGNTINDSAISAALAISHGGPASTVSRATITPGFTGVQSSTGTLQIDDSLIDLGTANGGVGLDAQSGIATTMTINARHLTVVGGGTSSVGVRSLAVASVSSQTTNVTLRDSIIDGPQFAARRLALNNSGPGPNTANLTLSYVNYDSSLLDSNGANGAGATTSDHLTQVDPGFVSATDFHLTPGSPLIDAGDPDPAGPATDLDGAARVQNGKGAGAAIRDLGAYELADTIAPTTTIDSGPSGETTDETPTFGFSSSEPGSSFRCSVDGGPLGSCSGPGATHTTAPLGLGPHTFSVVSVDGAGNGSQPATRAFTVAAKDTTPPDTAFAKAPKRKLKGSRLTVSFTSTEAGSTFECKLDKEGYAPCASPLKLKGLKRGKHVLSVRAIDAAGNADPTPATAKFKRAKPKRR
jgi:hypothetical protein